MIPNRFDEPDDALQTDIYLEVLLARHARPAGPRPSATPAGRSAEPLHAADGQAAPPDPSLAAAAVALERRLLRFHPSFRFEEALASRLRARAAAMGRGRDEPRDADAGGDIGTLVPFPLGVPPGDDATITDGPRGARGLLVGGAIASGVSLAGAALVAWRRTHAQPAPSRRRLVRAVRSAGAAAPRAPRLRAAFRVRSTRPA